MADQVACLCGGKVLLVEEGREPHELESPYAEQVGARERSVVQKNARKMQGRGAVRPGRAALRAGAAEQALPPARVVGLTRGRTVGELCYAISTGAVSGIFAQKPGSREEHRLFHNADAQIGEVDFSFADEAFTCTVYGKDGTSAIGILADDGKGMRTITEGDVLDRAPRWVPGGVGQIVYASSGIGRTQSGAWAGRAPFSLQRLNLRDSSVEVLVSDAKYDYLAPLPAAGSVIYAIRRPYEEIRHKPACFGAVKDALVAPVRLLFAPFRRFSSFGARDAGKSLIQRGSAQPGAADAERMMVWGNLVELGDAEDAAHAEGREAQGYELVRVSPQSTEALAQGVLAFDVAANGDIIYSNGRALYRMAPSKGSAKKQLAELARVEQIVIR